MSRIIPQLSAPERVVAIQEARRLLSASKRKGEEGKPVRWQHTGRTLRGLDCLGVLAWVLGRLGVAIEDAQDYSPDPDGVRLEAALESHFGPPIWRIGMERPRWKIRPGDVVLMRWHERMQDGQKLVLPNHVGMLTPLPYDNEGLAVLHCYAAQKTIVEHRLAAPWDRRILAVYSLTGGDW